MSLSYIAGVVVGIAAGVLIFLLSVRLKHGNWNPKSKYDERQRAAQGQCYRVAFWTLMIYLAAWYFLTIFDFSLPKSEWLLLIGMVLAILVYVIGCIFSDAYIGLNDSLKRWGISSAVLVLVNLFNAYVSFQRGSEMWVICLGCALTLMIVLLACGVKSLMNRSKVEEEE